MKIEITPTEITVTQRAHLNGQLVLDLDSRQVYPGKVIKRDASDPGPEWPDFVREEKIAADAYRRKQSRIGAVIGAVMDYLGRQPDVTPEIQVNETTSRQVVTLLDMELHGIGGHRKLGGPGGSTCRMSWATRLGKGRKQATDGPAWDEALKATREVFGGTPCNADEAVLFVAGTVMPEDCEWALCWALKHATEATVPTEAHAWMEVARCALREGDDAFRKRWEYRFTAL